MRVVVTGASGFLGQAIVNNLVKHGIETIGLSRRKLPGLMQISSYTEAPEADILVHLAEVSNRNVVNTPDEAFEKDTDAVINALIAKKYSRFIYASSALLYGDTCNWARRPDEQIKITDNYTRIKFACEQKISQAGGVIARFSNVYGHGMAKENVVSHILKQLAGNEPIMLQDTTPVRDFLWIEDAADAVVKMVRNNEQGIFNVGTSIGTSIKDLADLALHAAGQSGRPVFSQATSKRSSTLFLDITKTTDVFNWRPTTSLMDGLECLINKNVSAHA